MTMVPWVLAMEEGNDEMIIPHLRVGSHGQSMVPLMGHSLPGQAHALTMVITIAEPPAYLLWSLFGEDVSGGD